MVFPYDGSRLGRPDARSATTSSNNAPGRSARLVSPLLEEGSPMATSTYTLGPTSSNVLLRPTKRSFLLLLPLLLPVHHPPTAVTLPAETWFRCIDFAMDLSRDIHPGMSPLEREKLERCRRDLVRVCKSFKVGNELHVLESMHWSLMHVASTESCNTDPLLPCHTARYEQLLLIPPHSQQCRTKMGLAPPYSIFRTRPLGPVPRPI
jgi:hypothetical protein